MVSVWSSMSYWQQLGSHPGHHDWPLAPGDAACAGQAVGAMFINVAERGPRQCCTGQNAGIGGRSKRRVNKKAALRRTFMRLCFVRQVTMIGIANRVAGYLSIPNDVRFDPAARTASTARHPEDFLVGFEYFKLHLSSQRASQLHRSIPSPTGGIPPVRPQSLPRCMPRGRPPRAPRALPP